MARIEIPTVVLSPSSPYGPVSGAQVSIVNRDGSGAATVYVDESGTGTRTQPLATDTSGRVDGWVERGSYELTITIPGRPSYKEYLDAAPAKNGGIDTGWLASNAVTTVKIADNAVTTDKIAAGAVQTADLGDRAVTGVKIALGEVKTENIQDSAVTASKISPGSVVASALASNVVPLGTVIDWWRPSGSTPIPTGWAVCDGRAWSQISNDFGLSTGNIPNLVGKVTMGARPTVNSDGTGGAADGTNSTNGDAYGNAPGVGGVGGSNNSKNLAHSHYTDHTHYFNHSHHVPVPDHLHYIYGESPGTSSARVTGGTSGAGDLGGSTRANGSRSTGSYSVSADYAQIVTNGHSHSVDCGWHGHSVNGHSHGGATTGSDRGLSVWTNSQNNNYTNAMNGRQYTDGASWSADPGSDFRPAHVGLLKIMKVRNV